jgi:hypothetical protein
MNLQKKPAKTGKDVVSITEKNIDPTVFSSLIRCFVDYQSLYRNKREQRKPGEEG